MDQNVDGHKLGLSGQERPRITGLNAENYLDNGVLDRNRYLLVVYQSLVQRHLVFQN